MTALIHLSLTRLASTDSSELLTRASDMHAGGLDDHTPQRPCTQLPPNTFR